jgi:hypothetical protein
MNWIDVIERENMWVYGLSWLLETKPKTLQIAWDRCTDGHMLLDLYRNDVGPDSYKAAQLAIATLGYLEWGTLKQWASVLSRLKAWSLDENCMTLAQMTADYEAVHESKPQVNTDECRYSREAMLTVLSAVILHLKGNARNSVFYSAYTFRNVQTVVSMRLCGMRSCDFANMVRRAFPQAPRLPGISV